MAETGILGVKSWRQRKGISLESIAASTKLSVRQLDAIEAGDFKRLPGGIYTTSYIKQYAQAIGFDETDLLAYYNEACNPGGEQGLDGHRAQSRIGKPAWVA
jgi:cytoskeleton protein RodZ